MHGGGFGFLPGRANASALVAASALLAYDKLAGVAVGYGPAAGGRVVQIIGVGFTGASGVTFGGTAGTSFSVVSDQLVEVTTPAKTAGAVDVVVQHPNGNSTITGGYEYAAAPSISGATLSATTDYHNGGTLITVTGATGIRAGQTLALGGVAVGFTYISATSFSFVTRSIAVTSVGAKDLVITDLFSAASTKTSAVTFSVNPNPARFTSGAAMDAAAVVGGEYQLIGATTGAVIVSLECATVGPVTYKQLGRARWYQATGTEFDGVYKWVRVGAAGAFTWGGTPGSRSLGGLKPGGGGTIELQGLALQGGAMATHFGHVYLTTADSAPASGRCLLFGWTRPGVTTTIFGGGYGYTGASPRAAAAAAQARDAPTLTLGGTLTLTTAAEWVMVGGTYPNTSSNTTAWGQAQTGVQSVLPAGANGTGIQGTFDSRPAITHVGDAAFFILETSFTHSGTT